LSISYTHSFHLEHAEIIVFKSKVLENFWRAAVPVTKNPLPVGWQKLLIMD